MRPKSLLGLFSLACLLMCLSAVPSPGRGCLFGRRGGACASGGCASAGCASGGCASGGCSMGGCAQAVPEFWQFSACPQCASCASCATAANGCNCCDGCNCSADSCPCKLGKTPCSPDCKCLLNGKTTCTAKPAVDPVQFPGVLAEHNHKNGDRYQVNGREVSRREAFQAVSTVPDDRKQLSLTFIGGTDAERAEAVKLAQEIGLDRKVLVHAFPADYPVIAGKGYVQGTILQRPDGLPLLRSTKMDRGTLLAAAETASAYDPAKDPTPDGFTLADLEKKLAALPGWAWAAVGGVVVFLYLRKKDQSK